MLSYQREDLDRVDVHSWRPRDFFLWRQNPFLLEDEGLSGVCWIFIRHPHSTMKDRVSTSDQAFGQPCKLSIGWEVLKLPRRSEIPMLDFIVMSQ